MGIIIRFERIRTVIYDSHLNLFIDKQLLNTGALPFYTQKFNNVFCEKRKKGGFRGKKLSQNRPETAFHQSDSVQ